MEKYIFNVIKIEMNLLDIQNDIRKEIKEVGIYKIDKFLNDQDLITVEKILNKYKSEKQNNDSFFYRSRGKFLLEKLVYFQLSKLIDCLTIIRLSKKLKLQDVANNVLGQQTRLTSIDSYFSKKSNENILDWHLDQAYSGKLNVENFVNPDHAALKFFVYLTAVDVNNGSLGYIPKTAKIAYQLKKDIYNKEIKYRPYWSLKDFRNIIKDSKYRKHLEKKIDATEIESFLNQTSFIEKDPYDTTKYDYKLDKGGAIIFDESGVHRGSKPNQTDRLVMRFVYKISTAPD